MLSSTVFLFTTLFASLTGSTLASCLDSTQACEDGSGACLLALNTFLTSDNEARRDIWNVLSYGHYCGASTKCVADNLEKGEQGVGPGAPAACNLIDQACYEHDACLMGSRMIMAEIPRSSFPCAALVKSGLSLEC